jgi:Beta protein
LDSDIVEEPFRYPLIFDHHYYVPCLTWKQGEYQALLRLLPQARTSITPLINIPEIGWDFETETEAKTIDEHLAKFATRLSQKWGDRWAFVDLRLIAPTERMRDGQHPLEFVFNSLRRENTLTIPVTGLHRDRAYQTAVAKTISRDKSGLCVRLSIEDATSDQLLANLAALLAKLSIEAEDVHLVLDLESPNFEPLEAFTQMVRSVIARLPELNRWRTYTICATSFPRNMGQLKVGAQIIRRFEWLFYKKLLKTLGSLRKPTFGDYAIAHPDPVRIDMRLIKPAASIRYTIKDGWYVVKGTNVRDNGTAQYTQHCALLLASGLFSGATFSTADAYIRKCALRRVKPGGLTTWRWVGTNHHIEKTVADLAKLSAS